MTLLQAWPAIIRGVFGDQERYEATYFSPYKGYYFTGDGARRDADGYYWITGRVDDVINVSGHRIGTAEVESALVLHETCAEAAVVGYDHPIKGMGIYAYVTLMDGVAPNDALKKELVKCATPLPAALGSNTWMQRSRASSQGSFTYLRARHPCLAAYKM
jgi:acetyl-CoA synthetase